MKAIRGIVSIPFWVVALAGLALGYVVMLTASLVAGVADVISGE